jgi:hypothetical protein
MPIRLEPGRVLGSAIRSGVLDRGSFNVMWTDTNPLHVFTANQRDQRLMAAAMSSGSINASSASASASRSHANDEIVVASGMASRLNLRHRPSSPCSLRSGPSFRSEP